MVVVLGKASGEQVSDYLLPKLPNLLPKGYYKIGANNKAGVITKWTISYSF
jgi:hypothetical protein